MALGLAGLLVRRGTSSRRRRTTAVLAVVGVALAAVVAALAGQPQYLWLPPLALCAVGALFALLRSPALEAALRTSVALVRRPRVQWAALLLVGAAGLVWECRAIDREWAPPEFAFPQVEGETPLNEEPEQWAVTDLGRRIPLFAVARPETGEPLPPPDEAALLHRRDLALSVIRREGPSTECNCHGWVFTGGRHWVRGAVVEQILEDNAYCPVSVPEPGDLAVYRDKQLSVAHSGVVRSVGDDGLILIESKWGRLGRYVHQADHHAYPDTICEYYHSERGTHLLRGLGAPGSPASPSLGTPPTSTSLMGG
jgi:hypothetical protein